MKNDLSVNQLPGIPDGIVYRDGQFVLSKGSLDVNDSNPLHTSRLSTYFELDENEKVEPLFMTGQTFFNDPNYLHDEIQRQVASHQIGRSVNQLLKVDKDAKKFIYSSTNVMTEETVNYIVPYSIDQFGVKCEFAEQAIQVVSNEAQVKKPKPPDGTVRPLFNPGLPHVTNKSVHNEIHEDKDDDHVVKPLLMPGMFPDDKTNK